MITLVRHGETIWSKEKKHTSTTDLPLTDRGLQEAELLKERLRGRRFDQVFTSPLLRARETAGRAGFPQAKELDLLIEWRYGAYEGLTSEEIWREVPGWNIFTHGAPQGESVQDLERRVQTLIHFLKGLKGEVLLFSSGHLLRALGTLWIEAPLSFGKSFILSTASISILGFEHKYPAIISWNLS